MTAAAGNGHDPCLADLLGAYGARWKITQSRFCWTAVQRPTPSSVIVVVSPTLAGLAVKLETEESGAAGAVVIDGSESMPGLGPLESAVMTVVWAAGRPVTVRVCHERLDYRTADGGLAAYTTVSTIMGILARKNLLTRVMVDDRGIPWRQWQYKARVSRDGYLAALIREALSRAEDPEAVLRLVSAAT